MTKPIRTPDEDQLPLLTVASHFWPKIVPNKVSGCWIWNGAKEGTGNRIYGRMIISHRSVTFHVTAHRYALSLRCGRWLSKTEWALHQCHVPLCCNPMHLYVGDGKDNARDAVAAGRMKIGGPGFGQKGYIDEKTAIEIIKLFSGLDGNSFHYQRFAPYSRWTVARLSARFNSNVVTIRNIVTGRAASSASLSDDQIKKIKALWHGPHGQGRFPETKYKSGKWTVITLAKKFETTKACVYYVVQGLSFKHLDRNYPIFPSPPRIQKRAKN